MTGCAPARNPASAKRVRRRRRSIRRSRTRWVRRHPESGREAFFIGNHASHILGMDREEGEALLEEIEAHSTEDRFVYRHPWQPGDLLMWDNRCLLHRAESRTGEARVLHRTVTRGTSPF